MLLERLQSVYAGHADYFVAARAAVPALRIVEGQKLADAAAFEHEQVREPLQVHVHRTMAPHAGCEVDIASQRDTSHDIAYRAESAGRIGHAQIHFVVEFSPRVSADQLGLVTRRKVLPCAESVDHVGRIELLTVETGPEEHGVVVVQRGVVVGGDQRPPAETGVAVASREIYARIDGADIARLAAPCVQIADLDEQRSVEVDHVALRLDVAVRKADFIVRRTYELLAQPHVQLRVVEVASGRKIRRVETSQNVGDFVFDDVAAV